MTEQNPGHSVFDELAAGHALNALEPADEQLFLRHAVNCPDCSRAVADFQEVMAALAESAPLAEPSPGLGDRIMAAALADLGRDRPADRDIRSGSTETRPHSEPTPSTPAPRHAPGPQRPGPQRPGPQGPRSQGPGQAPGPQTPGQTPGPQIIPMRQRHAARRQHLDRRWKRATAIAAALVLIAGGGVWAGLAETAGSPSAPLAICAQPHKCSEVTLVSAATHQVAAKVVVLNGEVWMVPADMAANNPIDQIYVLWQITGAHTPRAVGSFDVKTGAQAPIEIGALAAPYSGTWAFAVSLEHGTTIPATPSRAVALGQVS